MDTTTGATTGALAGAVLGASGGALGLLAGAAIGGVVGAMAAAGPDRPYHPAPWLTRKEQLDKNDGGEEGGADS